MPTAKLYLKEKNAPKVTRILCIISDSGGVHLRISTGVSISPKHWSVKNQKVLGVNSNATELNKQLGAFRDKVLSLYLEARNNGIKPTTSYLTELMKPKKEATTKNKEFWDIWQGYLEIQKRKHQIDSFKKYKSIEKHLKGFEEKEKLPFTFPAIKLNTLDRLQEYMNTIAKLNNKTSSTYLKHFKTFLSWAVDNGYSENTTHKKFTPIKPLETLKVILTDSDIEKIKTVDLGQKEYLKNAREWLLLSVYTGLRYSDYHRISKEHIKTTEKGRIIDIRQKKTGGFVALPLVGETERIIDKILSGETHSIANQSLNKYMKELCQLAGIDELFEVHEFRGKFTTTKKVPKYELITSHTGRRTFATRMLLKGLPAETIMKFTGHKTLSSFWQYVNIPEKTEMDLIRVALGG